MSYKNIFYNTNNPFQQNGSMTPNQFNRNQPVPIGMGNVNYNGMMNSSSIPSPMVPISSALNTGLLNEHPPDQIILPEIDNVRSLENNPNHNPSLPIKTDCDLSLSFAIAPGALPDVISKKRAGYICRPLYQAMDLGIIPTDHKGVEMKLNESLYDWETYISECHTNPTNSVPRLRLFLPFPHKIHIVKEIKFIDLTFNLRSDTLTPNEFYKDLTGLTYDSKKLEKNDSNGSPTFDDQSSKSQSSTNSNGYLSLQITGQQILNAFRDEIPLLDDSQSERLFHIIPRDISIIEEKSNLGISLDGTLIVPYPQIITNLGHPPTQGSLVWNAKLGPNQWGGNTHPTLHHVIHPEVDNKEKIPLYIGDRETMNSVEFSRWIKVTAESVQELLKQAKSLNPDGDDRYWVKSPKKGAHECDNVVQFVCISEWHRLVKMTSTNAKNGSVLKCQYEISNHDREFYFKVPCKDLLALLQQKFDFFPKQSTLMNLSKGLEWRLTPIRQQGKQWEKELLTVTTQKIKHTSPIKDEGYYCRYSCTIRIAYDVYNEKPTNSSSINNFNPQSPNMMNYGYNMNPMANPQAYYPPNPIPHNTNNYPFMP